MRLARCAVLAASFVLSAFFSEAMAAPAELTAADVASFFESSEALKAADAALSSGDVEAARRSLAEADDSKFRRFLAARADELAAESAKTPEAFQKAGRSSRALRGDFPQIADHFALQAAGLFAAAEDWDEALKSLSAIPASSRHAGRAALLRAKILDSKGELQAASDAWGRVAQGKDSGAAEALSAQAALLVRLNKTAEARNVLTKIWRDFPKTKLSADEEALLCLGNSGTERPAQGCPKFSDEDKVKRGERLVAAHHNQRGIAELSPLADALKFPSELGCRARFALGDAHRKERKHERAIEILTPVVENCPKQKEAALYALASSQSIAHPERGPVFYERYIREFPDSKKLDQAEWFAADLEIKNSQMAAVSVRLDRLVAAYPKSQYAPQALFKRFWNQWISGSCAKSAKDAQKTSVKSSEGCGTHLAKIIQGWPGNVEESTRAQYWLGRVRLAEGDEGDALKIWDELARRAPQRFYGAMALSQLEKHAPSKACAARREIAAQILGTPSSSAERSSVSPKKSLDGVSVDAARRDILELLPRPLSSSLKGDVRLDAALTFMRLGLSGESQSLLNAVSREKQLSRDDRMTLAILLGLSGDLRSAQMIARLHFARVFEKPLTASQRGLWMLAWPRAYRSLIEEKCISRGVAPDQLQALMREESALDPKARSWAGALGLTQFMPARAREVAKLAGIASFSESDLFVPHVAIELGCVWLGKLLEEFGGERIFAFAAYNADSRRVRAWKAAAPDGEMDTFVEQIPIAETRNYVKRLVRSEATYRWLYSPLLSASEVCGN